MRGLTLKYDVKNGMSKIVVSFGGLIGEFILNHTFEEIPDCWFVCVK